MTTGEFKTALRRVDLRVTRPRLAVLEALNRHPHVDTDTVISLVRAGGTPVSHQGVYDVLHVLTDAGLVRRIQPSGCTARYELQTSQQHHHLVCRSCGTIVDVDRAVGETDCLTATDDRNFVIDEAEIVFWGLCPACRTTGTVRSSTPIFPATTSGGDEALPPRPPLVDPSAPHPEE